MTSSDVERHYDVLSQHITCYDSVLPALNSTVKATTDKEDLKETNFSENMLSKWPGRLRTEVLKSQAWGASTRFRLPSLGEKSACLWFINIYYDWREMFKYISIHRCVLISCTAVNHPYDHVLWYCSRWRGCLLRASYFHQDSHQVRWHAGSCEKYRRHATSPTSQPLVARWHDFKSIKVARNLILLWPAPLYRRDLHMHVCHRFDLGTHRNKQTQAKWFYTMMRGTIFDFASFWEDPYL